jgi:hypothetical protein
MQGIISLGRLLYGLNNYMRDYLDFEMRDMGVSVPFQSEVFLCHSIVNYIFFIVVEITGHESWKI